MITPNWIIIIIYLSKTLPMNKLVMKITIQAMDEPKSGSIRMIKHGTAVIGPVISILKNDLFSIGNFFGASP